MVFSHWPNVYDLYYVSVAIHCKNWSMIWYDSSGNLVWISYFSFCSVVTYLIARGNVHIPIVSKARLYAKCAKSMSQNSENLDPLRLNFRAFWLSKKPNTDDDDDDDETSEWWWYILTNCRLIWQGVTNLWAVGDEIILYLVYKVVLVTSTYLTHMHQ